MGGHAPYPPGGYVPAFKGLSVVSNCLRSKSGPLTSETKFDKLACKHRYTHTHYMKLYIYVFDLYSYILLVIDNRLTFKDHINMLCQRANYKLHALRRIRKYLTLEKSKLLYNNFINNQFNYASIIWMFSHKQDYFEVEKIHYKALKIV